MAIGAASTDPPPPGGITPALWRSADDGSTAIVDPAGIGPAAAVGGPRSDTGSGPARGRATPSRITAVAGGDAGWIGAMAATPDLLARVAALPPARDEPPDLGDPLADRTPFSLGGFLRPFRRQFALGLLLVILDAVATLAGPFLIRRGLDDGVAVGSAHALWVASGIFLLVTALDLVDSVFQVFITGRTAERLLFSLRVRIWAQLQRLSIDFYEREMGGRIMTRMTTDVDALATLLQTGLINAIVALFTFVGVGIALIAWNWELGLVTMSVVAPLGAATVVYRRRSSRAYHNARERIAVVNANMQESLSGVRESQAFRREDRNRVDFRAVAGGYLDARLVAQRLVALYFPFVEFLSDIAAVLVLGVASVLIARRSLTAGELVGFLLYLDLFFNPIQQLSQTFDSYQQAGASMAQIRGLLATPTLVESPPPGTAVVPSAVHGRLTFDGVRFTYPSARAGQEALRGVELEIAAGETLALVGETGAGKSTIVKLLTRFYDPTAGAVRIDGVDLRDLDLAAYRHHLGYVPQEPFLFSGTIRDNIAFGRPDASDVEVEAAARAVGAHEVVAGLSGGYLHRVTERGRSLSTGQRQLIALARAELVQPAVLLLDEATSNLDLASEARVARAMTVLAEGRTTVVIAHRLQTARRAGRIVVMDGGRVVEDGTHDELLHRNGVYARMWRAFELSAAEGEDRGAA